MNVFICDKCGKQTNMHPPTKPIFKEVETEHKVADLNEDGEPKIKKGKVVYKTVIKKHNVPVMVKTIVKHPHTHEPVETEIQKVEDLGLRAMLVQCRVVGRDNVQKDFCLPCFNEFVKPEMQKFLDFLNTFKDQ